MAETAARLSKSSREPRRSAACRKYDQNRSCVPSGPALVIHLDYDRPILERFSSEPVRVDERFELEDCLGNSDFKISFSGLSIFEIVSLSSSRFRENRIVDELANCCKVICHLLKKLLLCA